MQSLTEGFDDKDVRVRAPNALLPEPVNISARAA